MDAWTHSSAYIPTVRSIDSIPVPVYIERATAKADYFVICMIHSRNNY